MKSVAAFAERKPLVFVLTLLVCWMIAGGISAVLAGLLSGRELVDPLSQTAGTLAATLLILLLAHRLGWASKMGIVSPGSLLSWAVTLLVSVYVLLASFYAFFGDFSFQFSSLFGDQAQRLFGQALRAGLVEEVVFRGMILYSLLRAWGARRRGILAALLVQAALFAFLHALQVFAGVSPASAIGNVLATLVFGVWTGALVLAAGSVWPAVFVHSISNAFPQIKGISSAWITPYYAGYLRGALLELPLVLLGLWFVLKWRERQEDGFGESPEPHGAD